jgi:hypothetical protein
MLMTIHAFLGFGTIGRPCNQTVLPCRAAVAPATVQLGNVANPAFFSRDNVDVMVGVHGRVTVVLHLGVKGLMCTTEVHDSISYEEPAPCIRQKQSSKLSGFARLTLNSPSV